MKTPAPGNGETSRGFGQNADETAPADQEQDTARQLRLLEEREDSLRRDLRSLDLSREGVEASVSSVLAAVWDGEDMGLGPEGEAELLRLREAVLSDYDEREEALRRGLRDVGQKREGLLGRVRPEISSQDNP